MVRSGSYGVHGTEFQLRPQLGFSLAGQHARGTVSYKRYDGTHPKSKTWESETSLSYMMG